MSRRPQVGPSRGHAPGGPRPGGRATYNDERLQTFTQDISPGMTLTFDDEYRALHGDAVWVDRSARDARLEVRGPDATEWLHGLLTQDVKGLHPGEGAYAAYLTPQGRMVADLRVFHRGDTFLIETVAATRATLLSRLDQFVIMEDVTIADVTDALGCVTILGPTAAASASACTGVAQATLNALPEHGHLPLDRPGAFVAASREFGVPAFDLFALKDDLAIWQTLLAGPHPDGQRSPARDGPDRGRAPAIRRGHARGHDPPRGRHRGACHQLRQGLLRGAGGDHPHPAPRPGAGGSSARVGRTRPARSRRVRVASRRGRPPG